MASEPKPGDPKDGGYRLSDPEALARNLAKVAERGTALLGQLATPKASRALEQQIGDGLAEGVRTFGRLVQAWADDPKAVIQAQSELWHSQVELWRNAVRRSLGEDVAPLASPPKGDKRFTDPEWTENVFFDFLKQSYLISAAWAERMVESTEDLDAKTRHKAGFYVRQLANALSPTNFVLTNPQVLRETLATNGENLVKGIQNLADDFERGHGQLMVKQTDLSAFEVGRNLAVTKGKVVYQNEILQLIQYAPTTPTVFAVPLLIVPPWINKFYILDLAPGKSFVEWLAGQGHTVFVVSWVNPDETAAAKTFADYMTEGILAALAAVLDITKQTQANAMGYCVGGTLLAATLAWLAARGDPRIASAALLTAQVDFTNAGDLSVFVDEAQLDAMEKRIAEQGYLAGQSMARTFNMLRSNDLVWSYAVNNYLMGREPPPFDLLYWNSDSTRLPAVNHLFYLRQCYVENRLARGEMELAGTRLDLGAIDVPIFNLATREDHIAPAPSVFNGGRMLGGAVRFVLAGSGHIAGVVNPPDKVKYQYWADGSGASLADWLATATETPGSWWPELQRWLEPFAGAQVKARRPGVRGYKAIEDAPGSYVRLRAD